MIYVLYLYTIYVCSKQSNQSAPHLRGYLLIKPAFKITIFCIFFVNKTIIEQLSSIY